MSPREGLEGFAGGMLAGVAGGLFGVGGGVLLVPILTGRFRVTQHQAHGTSLAVIGLSALAGLAVYGAYSRVMWGTAVVVGLGSIFTARYGARWANRLSTAGLRRSFALFLVLVAARLLLFRTPEGTVATFHHGWVGTGFDLLLGGMIGLLSGFMGVGGGMLAVPAFTLVLGMAQQVAQGTSLAVILFSGPAGAIEHARHGNVVWSLVPVLALGATAGAPLSSWLALQLPHQTLVRAFAVFLLANGMVSWFKAKPRMRDATS
jgi:uncharacterized membrane protein YfcA